MDVFTQWQYWPVELPTYGISLYRTLAGGIRQGWQPHHLNHGRTQLSVESGGSAHTSRQQCSCVGDRITHFCLGSGRLRYVSVCVCVCVCVCIHVFDTIITACICSWHVIFTHFWLGQVGDVGPNSKLSKHYNNTARKWWTAHPGFTMKKHHFNCIFTEAYRLYEEELRKEFEDTGTNTIVRAYAYTGFDPLVKESPGLLPMHHNPFMHASSFTNSIHLHSHQDGRRRSRDSTKQYTWPRRKQRHQKFTSGTSPTWRITEEQWWRGDSISHTLASPPPHTHTHTEKQ